MTTEIFKIQRPLAGDMCQVLVYNKDRSIESQVPMTTDLQKLFGSRAKIYHMAKVEGGELILGEPVEPQEW